MPLDKKDAPPNIPEDAWKKGIPLIIGCPRWKGLQGLKMLNSGCPSRKRHPPNHIRCPFSKPLLRWCPLFLSRLAASIKSWVSLDKKGAPPNIPEDAWKKGVPLIIGCPRWKGLLNSGCPSRKRHPPNQVRCPFPQPLLRWCPFLINFFFGCPLLSLRNYQVPPRLTPNPVSRLGHFFVPWQSVSSQTSSGRALQLAADDGQALINALTSSVP